MKIKKILSLSFILIMSTQFAFANYAFYKKVANTCKFYRVSVDEKKMSLVKNSDGSYNFTIEMESLRNNFEMVMLVGFAAVGHAIEHQIQMGEANAYTPESITMNIAVPISQGETNMFVATCSKQMAIELANGTMESSDVMQEINMEIQ